MRFALALITVAACGTDIDPSMVKLHSEPPCTRVPDATHFVGSWSLDWSCGQRVIDGDFTNPRDCNPDQFPIDSSATLVVAQSTDAIAVTFGTVAIEAAANSDPIVYIGTSNPKSVVIEKCSEGYARVSMGWGDNADGTTWYARADRL